MKKNVNNLKRAVAGALIALASGVSFAATSLFTLPTPENNVYASYGTFTDAQGIIRDAIMMNGIPIALKYDDYWSYSAQVLDAIQSNTSQTTFLPQATFGTYDFSVGTGTIAVNMSSNAGGATNVNPNGSGVNFQDPVDLQSNNNLYGWQGVWGGDPQTYTEDKTQGNPDSYSSPAASQGGTTTVGNLLTYLHTLDPNASIPVIYADYNQTGDVDSLWFSMKIEVWDSTHTKLKDWWTLDAETTPNNTLNPLAPTFNYGYINFYGNATDCANAGPYNPFSTAGCVDYTDNGDKYLKLSHNKGSGQPDFLAYSPDMDLSKFLSTDLFIVTMNVGCYNESTTAVGPLPDPSIQNPITTMGCNTNGGEEFGIVGAIAPNRVPEPSSLALFGLSLLGLMAARRRRIA